MAKTRKRQIKQRGGGPCLFVLGSIIDSIGTLINTVGKIEKKTEIEKINKINNDLSNFIETAFNKQINDSCTDIKKSDYTSLINSLDALSAKFAGKQDIFSVDTQIYLTRIETMKTRASKLSESIIEPLPNPPQIKSKTVKKKTPPKVVKNTNVMPPIPLLPTLSSVVAATPQEKAAREAAKNAKKKDNRATRKAAEQAAEDAKKAAEAAASASKAEEDAAEEAKKAAEAAASASKAEEAARKKIAKTIANEAASKIAAKKNAEKQKNIKATVQMLEEKAARKAAEEAAEEEAARKAAARKAAEEESVNNITKTNIMLFFENFTKDQITPLGIITQEHANKYVTTLFPNIKFTDKITDYQKSASIQQPDSENYMYLSYLYMIYIGILNNYLHFLTVKYQYNLFAGLKLIFKGGRAAQIMLPKGSNLLSDDTDIFIQSTKNHSPFFLKTFAVQLAKSWSKSQQLISGIGKVNPNIVKISYRGSTRFIPISDIDFGSPTYPQYYDDIRMVHKTWNIIQEPLTDEGKPATKLATKLATKPATKLATRNISLDLVYYHQSPESFFAEKQFIYDMYLDPIYKTCDCGVVPHTEDCIASCSERQFYLDKFKKYVDVKTTQSLSKRVSSI